MPSPAFAGAWIAPEGGQEIWSNAIGERDGLTYTETSAYLEQPIGGQNSLVAAPWFEQNFDTLDGWRGEATIGFKRALGSRGEWTFALQPGALWVSHPPVVCGEGGAELRALSGRNVSGAGFINVEVAARVLEGGCGESRVDLTAGYRPNETWLALGEVFFHGPEDSEESFKAQLSIVRFGRDGRALQLGVRARVDGEDAEPALVVGVWGRPGD